MGRESESHLAIASYGAAPAEFLATPDEALDLWFSPDPEPACFEPATLPSDATGCPFVSLWDPFNGVRAYRGPLGSYLVRLPTPPVGPAREASVWGAEELHDWDVALVVSDGRPVLQIGAGRIAG